MDISNRYSDWTRRNFALNGYAESANHRILTQDCLDYLNGPVRRHFDVIVCDPPTFSNSKKMKKSVFSIDEDYVPLIAACLNRLTPNGCLLFSTNSRKFRMDVAALPEGIHVKEITAQTIPKDFEGSKIHRSWRIRKDSPVFSAQT